jgi:S1-C subfamily serine protease
MEIPMANPTILVQFSDALSALAEHARTFVAGIRTVDGEVSSGVLWRRNAVVVSEQTLPQAPAYEVTIGDQTIAATLAGRDEGTNVAVLKLERDLAGALPAAGAAKAGALALVLGTANEGVSARLALVRSVGGAWQSLAGATIDQRIVLDTPIGPKDEGGPVLAADGAIFGISTRGSGRQSLVIPAATVDKAVAVLLEKGSVERGWLGVALRPIALPETLRPKSTQRVGLMVMDVGVESPAAKAGILAGDILLTAGGTPATRFGNVTRRLGPDSVGKTLALTLARAGAIITAEAMIDTRKRA